MRATIHMVSAADYWPMRSASRRVGREWCAQVAGPEIEELDMEASPRPSGGARRRAAADEGSHRAARGARVSADRRDWAGTWVDLVRVPPSGTWERRRADLYGLADAWLPPPGRHRRARGSAAHPPLPRRLRAAPLRTSRAGWASTAGRSATSPTAWSCDRSATRPAAAARPARRAAAGSGDASAASLPGGLGRHPAGPRPTHADPARGVSPAHLQHEDAALGQHLPARRPGGRHLASRGRRDQPRSVPDADAAGTRALDDEAHRLAAFHAD